MIHVTTWAKREAITSRPWLVLGKGPSFAHYREIDTSGYYTIGLNHVFGKPSHNLDSLATQFGSREKAIDAIGPATEYAVRNKI